MYQGRTLIEERLAETFAASPGAKMAIEIEAIRAAQPGCRQGRGPHDRHARQGRAGDPPPLHRTARQARRQLAPLQRARRTRSDGQPARPAGGPRVDARRLDRRGARLGRSASTAAGRMTATSCIRTFTVKQQGKDVMTVNQRIGWDPAAKQIRSWEFDSQGGFGEGKWGGDGDRWVIKHTATRPDGTTVSATNTMVRERPDLVRWTSTDRFVGHRTDSRRADLCVRRGCPRRRPHTAKPRQRPAAPDQTERSPR